MDGTTETRKTPADFEKLVQSHNVAIDTALDLKAAAVEAIDRAMEAREKLVKEAPQYGLTGSYARALLRKG